ncbi:glycosyltransferase family 25 protein [Aureimonas frigidaquae]|uniref:glycosyltransferase family 25 protein n=1 Tax=Aureimonas frigidaquae TaxID=424757 RepID=UPI000784E711|nr:glycosyltransferase family 25 protein [Aureimonas frigidaquae]
MRPSVPAERRLGVFAINLDRSPERWQALQQAFGPLPYRLQRIAALDARNAPEQVLAVRGLSITLPPAGIGYTHTRGREYLLVQEACFAGHMMALEAFLASDLDLALILEDDAEPCGPLAQVLAAMCRMDHPFPLVRLEGLRNHGRRLATLAGHAGPVALVRSLRPTAGSAAYVVDRAGARLLRENAGHRLVPFDEYFANPALTGCDIVYAAPFPVRQAEGDSIIGQSYRRAALRKQRGPGAYLRQAWVRAWLRAVLWARALAEGGIPGLHRW